MLLELGINNFALIEKINIKFQKGLNILTGETGAGKSILIDALSGVLGEKMTTDMIRSGFEKATLEGTFSISNLPQVKKILDDSGIDFDDDILILRRELHTNSKGRCFANSTQIPLSKLKEISDYLVDIHGQNEHQSIVRIAKHREILDSFFRLQNLVEKINKIFYQLNNLQEKISSYQIDEREKGRRIEYLEFVIREIDSANLLANEENELRNESKILANAEKLFSEINSSSSHLNDESGIIQRLKRVEQSLNIISEYDPEIVKIVETTKEALYSLEDISIFLRHYRSNIDFSPERLNEVEARLTLIHGLSKKYGTTIQEILEYAERSREELNAISSSEDEVQRFEQEYKRTIKEAKETALELSLKRKSAATELEDRVMKELADLGMAGTVFRVSIKREISPDGQIETDNKRYVLYPHGIDKIEFLLSTNIGEDLRELRRVASGGEMSRIMLALKKAILSADIVESLVFDEVDAGIGGATAEIVGKKLKSLAQDRQVLVITHHPQIAAMSDSHFFIQKEMINARVITYVKSLNKEDRIREIARMLAGEKITDITIKHAKELISLADNN
ncbi:MAG: DNA repair protein RecN [Spirochaetota bacterium]|nr:DNA repair protein RecN [Spirochaetota bacterium]